MKMSGFNLVIATLLLSMSVHAGVVSSLCDKNEEILFTCSTGKKLISVCGSKGFSSEKGYLQYRFGQSGKVEITLPSARTVLPKDSALSNSLMFSGGGGATLRFAAGDFSYVVYTAIGKGWGEKEGVAVVKSGERKSYCSCKTKYKSELGPALFSRAGFKEDGAEFDLP